MQTILVIDDEANMRHMLTALLGKSGYAVTTAADGSEGLRLAGEHRFDFILCDLKMPVMDGLAFLAGMRAADLGGTVIMMSAYGTVDQAIETVKQGAYDYISKPFKLDEILLVLRKAEERERLRDENRQLRRRLYFRRDRGPEPRFHGAAHPRPRDAAGRGAQRDDGDLLPPTCRRGADHHRRHRHQRRGSGLA